MPANNSYRNLEERLFANTVIEGECWIWLGKRNDGGYPYINVRRNGKHRVMRAHRLSYEVFIGPIPEGLELDHTCRNILCIHPNHLEPITGKENIARMWKAREAVGA